MPVATYHYPLDPSGNNPNNLVEQEEHTLTNDRFRNIATAHGAFFTESISVIEKSSQRILVKDTDYYCALFYRTPSGRYGKEVCSVIVITDPTVSGVVELSYQAVGGPWSVPQTPFVQMLEALDLNNRPEEWGPVISRPENFALPYHDVEVGDRFGFEYANAALESIAQSTKIGDTVSHATVLAFFKAKLLEHLEDYDNPHQVTAHQLGGFTTDEIDALFDQIVGSTVISLSITADHTTAYNEDAQLILVASLYLLNQSVDQFEILLPDDSLIIAPPGQGGVNMNSARVLVPIEGEIGETVILRARVKDSLGNYSLFVNHVFEIVESLPINFTNFTHNIPAIALHNSSRHIFMDGASSASPHPLRINLTQSGIAENVYTPNTNIVQGNPVSCALPEQIPYWRLLTTTIQVTDGQQATGFMEVETEVVRYWDTNFDGPNSQTQTQHVMTFPTTGRYRVSVIGGGGNHAGGGGGMAVSTIFANEGETANITAGGRTTFSRFVFNGLTLTGNPGANGLGGAGGTASGGETNYTGENGELIGEDVGYWENQIVGYDQVPCTCCGIQNYASCRQGTFTVGCVPYNNCQECVTSVNPNACSGTQVYVAWNIRYNTFTQVPIYDDVYVEVYEPARGGAVGGLGQEGVFPWSYGGGGNENQLGQRGGVRITYLGR